MRQIQEKIYELLCMHHGTISVIEGAKNGPVAEILREDALEISRFLAARITMDTVENGFHRIMDASGRKITGYDIPEINYTLYFLPH